MNRISRRRDNMEFFLVPSGRNKGSLHTQRLRTVGERLFYLEHIVLIFHLE